MAEISGGEGTGKARAMPRRLRWWPEWVGYAAAWSLVYGLLGLWWALGGEGFPFGSESDPGAALSILEGVRPETGAPVIAALGLTSAVAAVAMARGRGRGMLRVALLIFASIAAAVLALAIPDYRVLVGVAYAPIILIGAPFGWPPGVSILDSFPWPVVNQFICIAGGLLWAATDPRRGGVERGELGGAGCRVVVAGVGSRAGCGYARLLLS